jgi:DNA-binding IclR family transcriptional regulator
MKYAFDLARTSRIPQRTAIPTNSLERALVVLELVAANRRGLTNKDLSSALGIATSTCSYILERLERNGFLLRNLETGRYSIGLKAIAIARGALRPLDFHKAAEPVLRQLSENTGLETVVGMLDQGQLLILSRISNGKFPRADVDTGTEFPPHTTAIGKILLAHLPAEEVSRLIERNGLPARTSRSITSKTKLMDELNAVRERGYSISDEEHEVGLRSVGVPLLDRGGGIDAALAAIGTVDDLVWNQNLQVTVDLLREAAREIAALRRSWTQARSTY